MYGYKRLADRLRKTTHLSPLRFKLIDLKKKLAPNECEILEEWLIEIANSRGATVVKRRSGDQSQIQTPSENDVSNEQLIVALCQTQCVDQPQILRLAAQLVSRENLDLDKLFRLAERERVEPILAEMARQVARIDPYHKTWNVIREHFHDEKPLREPLIHWTRLAEPKVENGLCQPNEWVLVS